MAYSPGHSFTDRHVAGITDSAGVGRVYPQLLPPPWAKHHDPSEMGVEIVMIFGVLVQMRNERDQTLDCLPPVPANCGKVIIRFKSVLSCGSGSPWNALEQAIGFETPKHTKRELGEGVAMAGLRRRGPRLQSSGARQLETLFTTVEFTSMLEHAKYPNTRTPLVFILVITPSICVCGREAHEAKFGPNSRHTPGEKLAISFSL
ncbi:hypothetical protein RSAG8_11146, partial [Rhizoctonia solani AG-8 WAC10335]